MKKVCDICGKEFDALGDWQHTCRDCYKKQAENAPGRTKYTPKTIASNSTSTLKPNDDFSDKITLLKKCYDEVVAAFAGDYPDSVGNPQVLHSIVATVYIEHNRRK